MGAEPGRQQRSPTACQNERRRQRKAGAFQDGDGVREATGACATLNTGTAQEVTLAASAPTSTLETARGQSLDSPSRDNRWHGGPLLAAKDFRRVDEA